MDWIKFLNTLSQEQGLQGAVLITIDKAGVVGVHSYATSKKSCHALGVWAQGLWKNAVSHFPFESHFGWGRNGKAYTAEEIERLPARERHFYDEFDNESEASGR